MKRICLLTLCFVIGISANAQTLKAKLDAAVKQLEKDAQLKHGLIGFSVIDAATGHSVYEKNGEVGLAPASTQKIFTSIAAFEILGKNYKYKTSLGVDAKADEDSVVWGPLYVVPSGDPTFGSWRFQNTRPATIKSALVQGMTSKGIKFISGGLHLSDTLFETQGIPDGWIWEDIGNYYGAGHYSFNWNENQYDLILKPGLRSGDPVEVIGTIPGINSVLVNELKTGAKESGDNAYIYFAPGNLTYVRGTVPCCVERFTISGSWSGWEMFRQEMTEFLTSKKVGPDLRNRVFGRTNIVQFYPIVDYYSPSLDSINFYFLKRSINLYGEALIRTIAREKAGIGSTVKGLELIRDFFESKGIEKSALGIIDGSGLSPQNRVTTNALTKALRYAKSRPWFSSFYYALPEINGMKMKSGLIGGVRSYAGYQKAANGKEYIFAIIVNNYDGSSSEINKKLFKILDYLK